MGKILYMRKRIAISHRRKNGLGEKLREAFVDGQPQFAKSADREGKDLAIRSMAMYLVSVFYHTSGDHRSFKIFEVHLSAIPG